MKKIINVYCNCGVVTCRDGDTWIGLYKYTSSSTDSSPSAQYWLDGSTSTFRRWSSGKPSDDTYCVWMKKDSGEFEDKDCTATAYFVCKKTKGR